MHTKQSTALMKHRFKYFLKATLNIVILQKLAKWDNEELALTCVLIPLWVSIISLGLTACMFWTRRVEHYCRSFIKNTKVCARRSVLFLNWNKEWMLNWEVRRQENLCAKFYVKYPLNPARAPWFRCLFLLYTQGTWNLHCLYSTDPVSLFHITAEALPSYWVFQAQREVSPDYSFTHHHLILKFYGVVIESVYFSSTLPSAFMQAPLAWLCNLNPLSKLRIRLCHPLLKVFQ